MPLDPFLKQAVHSTRWRIAAVVVILAVIATALLGGFRSAPKRVGASGPGARVTVGALAVQPLRAWVDRRDPKGFEDRSGKDVLVLEAVVENLTKASSNYYLPDDLRWLTGAEDYKGSKADVIYLVDDLTLHDYLHPRLPMRVLLCWKIPKDQSLPQPARWGLYQRRFVEKAYVNNESGWMQDGPGMTLKLPVEDRRTGAAP